MIIRAPYPDASGGMRLWTPNDLPAANRPAYWFDAQTPASLTTASGTVSNWADRRANGVAAAQPTAASQPAYQATGLNGYPALSNPDTRTLNIPASQVANFPLGTVDRWCLLVGAPAIAAGNRIAFGYGANAGSQMNLLGLINSRPAASFYGSDYQATGSASANTPLVLVTDIAAGSSASGVVGFNGTRNSVPAMSNGGTGSSAGGQIFNFVSIQAWTGLIGEIAGGTGALALADQQRIDGYAAWRWGTQASLPTNHPYYSAAPMVST